MTISPSSKPVFTANQFVVAVFVTVPVTVAAASLKPLVTSLTAPRRSRMESLPAENLRIQGKTTAPVPKAVAAKKAKPANKQD